MREADVSWAARGRGPNVSELCLKRPEDAWEKLFTSVLPRVYRVECFQTLLVKSGNSLILRCYRSRILLFFSLLLPREQGSMFVNSALPRLEKLVTPVLPRAQNSMFLNSEHGGPEIPGTTCNRKLISTSDSRKAVLIKDKGPLGSQRTNCIFLYLLTVQAIKLASLKH